MSSSQSITEMYTEMYTEISTAIKEKDIAQLQGALSDRFHDRKNPLTTEELVNPIYSLALSCAATSTDKRNVIRVTKLLMQNIFSNKHAAPIPALLTALQLAANAGNTDFIKTVLDESAPELVQNLLIEADLNLLNALQTIPKLLEQPTQPLLPLLEQAFQKNNINLAIKLLKEDPTLLIQYVEKNNTLPPLIEFEKEVPTAVEALFSTLVGKKNLELIGAGLSEQNSSQFHTLAKETPAMINLLKSAIKKNNIKFVIAALDNNPQLLFTKSKSMGKKPIVLAATLHQWAIVCEIASRYPEQHENGDFHIALLLALQANTNESIAAALELDLNSICTSAETIPVTENNILHYAMLNNNEAIIKKIFVLADAKVLRSLIKNSNVGGHTPIEYAAHHKQWAAVALHAKLYIPKTKQEYDKYYLPVLEMAIKDGSEEALTAALALMDTYRTYKTPFSPDWIVARINEYLLKREPTELSSELFARLLQGAENVEAIINQLNIEEALFIDNLLKIQDKIDAQLFKRLVYTIKNGKTVIEHAMNANSMAALTKAYTPQNPEEYKACGYQNKLEITIKTNTGPSLYTASALLTAAKASGYMLNAKDIEKKIKHVIIDQKDDLEIRNTVMSQLIDFCADDQAITSIISTMVCCSEKKDGFWTKLKKYDDTKSKEIPYELEEENSNNADKIKESVKMLIGQITVPEIQLRAIIALLFNKKSSIWKNVLDMFGNGTRKELIKIAGRKLLKAEHLALEETFFKNFFEKARKEIGNTDLDEIKFKYLHGLIRSLISHLLKKDNISSSLLAQLTQFVRAYLIWPEHIKDICIDVAIYFKKMRSDASLQNYTMLLSSLLRNRTDNKLLQIALDIIKHEPMFDMTTIVMNMTVIIGDMLKEPSGIKLTIFTRLIENCEPQQRVAIIHAIAQKQSADVTQHIETNMIWIIQAIYFPKVRVDIILNVLNNENYTLAMKVELIAGFIIELNELDLAEFNSDILTMIHAIEGIRPLLDHTTNAKLRILQDFLRVIQGNEPLLTEISGTSPDAAHTLALSLYKEIIVDNNKLNKLFLQNLDGSNNNPESLIYKAINQPCLLRSLKKGSTTVDTAQMSQNAKQPVPTTPKTIAEKTMAVIQDTLPRSTAAPNSGLVNNSIFSVFRNLLPSSSSSSSFPNSRTATPLLSPSSLQGSAPSQSCLEEADLERAKLVSLDLAQTKDNIESRKKTPPPSPSSVAPASVMFPSVPQERQSTPTQQPAGIAALMSAPPVPTHKLEDEDAVNNSKPAATQNRKAAPALL